MSPKKLALGALALTIAAAPGQVLAQFDRKSVETIAAILLADKLKLDPAVVLGVVGTNRQESIYDMAPVFAVQRAAPRRSVDDIWAMRRRGMGWGEIAKAINMPPGEFNKLRVSGQLDPKYYWQASARDRLSIPQSTVNHLRSRGMTWKEIVNAAVIARESGRSIIDVANQYYRGTRNWNRVASVYRVRPTQINTRIASWRKTRAVPTQWVRVVDRDRDDWDKFRARTQVVNRTRTSSSHKSKSNHGSAVKAVAKSNRTATHKAKSNHGSAVKVKAKSSAGKPAASKKSSKPSSKGKSKSGGKSKG